MRAVTVSLVVAVLTVGAASIVGDAAASHQAKSAAPQSAGFPTWSPDGKQIAFVYTRHRFSPSARYRIVRTLSKPGGKLHTVLTAWGSCCEQMQWAADGRILITPSSRMKSLPAQGGEAKRLFFSSCDNSYGCQSAGFILSPNREYAADAITADDSDPHYDYGIGLVKLKSRAVPAVLSSPLTAEENATYCWPGQSACTWVWDTALAFSPDGRQLVFTRASWDDWDYGLEAPPALRAINLAGGGSVPLAQSGIPGASLVPNDATQVQWSPDGSWVAYVDADSTNYFQKLEVVPTTGAGTPRVLATCNYSAPVGFSWSPASNRIAYDCEGQSDEEESVESSQFETVKPDGTDATDLLSGSKLVYGQGYFADGPQWSPDGSRLLFMARRPLSGIYHVWTVRADGSHLTRRS